MNYNHTKNKKGIGLIEVLLATGIAVAIGSVAFAVYPIAKAKAEAKKESFSQENLVSAIRNSVGATGHYDTLTTQVLIQDKIVKSQDVLNGNIVNAWGGNVTPASANISKAGDGFSLTYSKVSSRSCSDFVNAGLSTRPYSILINNNEVLTTEQGLNIPTLSAQCANPTSVKFTYFDDNARGSYVASPLDLPPNPNPPTNPPTTNPIVDPESAQDGDQATTPGVVTPNPTTPATPPPAIPTIPGVVNPVNPPVVNPPVVPPTPTYPPGINCTPSSSNQNRNSCPAGYWGYQTFTLNQRCDDGVWGPPSSPTETMTTNACNACPGDYNSPVEEWRGSSRACPSGQQGTVTFEYLARVDRTYRYNCPAGTASLPSPVEISNSGWYNTGNERNVNTAGCSTPGMVLTNASAHLSVSNQSPYRIPGPVTLTETTSWTVMIGQSGEWPFSYGPMRGSAGGTITFNGSTQSISGTCNTGGTSSSQTCTQGPWTLNFNGRLIEFEFRGSSNPSSSTISGSARMYYRFKN